MWHIEVSGTVMMQQSTLESKILKSTFKSGKWCKHLVSSPGTYLNTKMILHLIQEIWNPLSVLKDPKHKGIIKMMDHYNLNDMHIIIII